MTSLCLQCNQCGKTLGMEQVFKDRIPHWSMSREFLEEAEKLGWFHEKDRALNHDLCPECYRVKAS